MKASTREGAGSKRKGHEVITEEEEAAFCEKNVLGVSSSRSLLNTVYFYNGKLFGIRGGEHRALTFNNFIIGRIILNLKKMCAKLFTEAC